MNKTNTNQITLEQLLTVIAHDENLYILPLMYEFEPLRNVSKFKNEKLLKPLLKCTVTNIQRTKTDVTIFI